MASAGSEASGLPATTFNAAGLNAHTVPHPVASNIDAVSVDGEILTTLQSAPGVPKAAATRPWPIGSADHLLRDAVESAMHGRIYEAAKTLALRRVTLHGMDQVKAALALRTALIEQALVKNGCV